MPNMETRSAFQNHCNFLNEVLNTLPDNIPQRRIKKRKHNPGELLANDGLAAIRKNENDSVVIEWNPADPNNPNGGSNIYMHRHGGETVSYTFHPRSPNECLKAIKQWLQDRQLYIENLIRYPGELIKAYDPSKYVHVEDVTNNSEYSNGEQPMYALAYRIKSEPLGAFCYLNGALRRADSYIVARNHAGEWHMFFHSEQAPISQKSEVEKVLQKLAKLSPNSDEFSALLGEGVERATAIDFLRTMRL